MLRAVVLALLSAQARRTASSAARYRREQLSFVARSADAPLRRSSSRCQCLQLTNAAVSQLELAAAYRSRLARSLAITDALQFDLCRAYSHCQTRCLFSERLGFFRFKASKASSWSPLYAWRPPRLLLLQKRFGQNKTGFRASMQPAACAAFMDLASVVYCETIAVPP